MRPGDAVRTLVRVSRPAGWPLMAAVCFAALWFTGATASRPVAALVLTAVFSVPLCLLGYGLNDLYDVESDARNPGRTPLSDPVQRRLVGRAAWGAAVLSLAAVALACPVTTAALVLAQVALAVAYSAPPVRLRDRPGLDSAANGAGYVLLPAAAGWSVARPLSQLPPDVWFVALAAAGVHAYAALRDVGADARAGHTTVAVAVGRRWAAVLCAGAFAGAAVGVTWGRWGFAAGALVALLTAAFPRPSVIRWGMRLYYGGFVALVGGYYVFLAQHLGSPWWYPGPLFAR